MKKEYLLAGTSIVLWASAAALVKVLLAGLDSMQITFFSSGFAFLFMLAWNIGTKNIRKWRIYKFTDYIQMGLIGFVGIFLYYLLFYMAVERLPVQDAFIINYLWPVMTVLFACILLKEKMTGRKAVALLLSFIGVMIVTTRGDILNFKAADIAGVVFAFSAAVVFGLYAVLNKRKDYDKQFSIMLYFFISFLVSMAYILIRQDLPAVGVPQILGLIWNGVFVYAIAQTTWMLALQRGNTAKISNLAFITPFLSLVYIYFFLHEAIGLYSIAGLLVIVLGILIQMKDAPPKAG
jgi:drug/metabolite transporter (DMT)-like permease